VDFPAIPDAFDEVTVVDALDRLGPYECHAHNVLG
jgi:hypothetical protein